MSHLRVLIANEPRAYREAMVAACRALRPRVEVLTGNPADLDADLDRLRPQLVVCSRLTAAVRNRAPAWAVLYPEGARLAVSSFGGEETVAPDLALADFLGLLDRAARLVPA